ncbi:MAG: hypothetical protein IT445_03080 [Phycisphaeraceae bacterium]|nr:hypothetical protein [Phycisphaeraceae bacterium]
MGAIAAVQLIKINTLTVGTDTYPDLEGATVQRPAPRNYNYIPENSTVVTKQTQIRNPAAPVSGRFTGLTLSHEALAGQEAASVTFQGTDAVGGGTKTVTLTTVKFGAFSGGGGAEAPGGSSLEFEALDYSIA